MSVRSTRRKRPAPARTREAILRAALELMSGHSYEATTVPEIAARAGVATGTIYLHFPSKEAVVNVLYRESKLEMQRFLANAMASASTPREGFRGLWRGLFEFSRKHPEAFRFLEMHRHLPYLEPASLEVSRAVFEGVADFVRRAQKQGAIRKAPPEVLISLAFGAFVGLAKEAECGHVRFNERNIRIGEEAVWNMLAA
ncbi:MAG TPA: TetR/AcrR family transcriptional regulator [Deltaproteobacteria bacterium]|nr:TetR/AcrR family transcriptional regulator [Deltaproteobacteria bacterium]